MGKSDPYLNNFYKQIKPKGETALLGFQNNELFNGELYDLSLKNWNINSKWKLPKLYDTIICTRCAYFSRDPEDFIKRCYDHLKPNGLLYVDWGLGDHWRFKSYKIGWVKDNEHEYAYEDNNFLFDLKFFFYQSIFLNKQFPLSMLFLDLDDFQLLGQMQMFCKSLQ